MNYPGIYRLALRMISNPQDAEDILQETFLKAYRHLPEFDGVSTSFHLALPHCDE